MIIYNPLDGDVVGYSIKSRSRHCFLITQLGERTPVAVKSIHKSIKTCCQSIKYSMIDASTITTGKDFLLKIWKLIASVPICVVVLSEETPVSTQANIFYELGVAQALGKETIIIKTPKSQHTVRFYTHRIH